MSDLNLTKRPTDNIIYLEPSKIPEIPLELLVFLEEQIPNRFPNLLEDDSKALIHYQGKLDLIAELRYMHELQTSPYHDENEDLRLH